MKDSVRLCLLALLCAALILCSGCGSSGTAAEAAQTASAASETAAPVPTPTPEPTPTPVPTVSLGGQDAPVDTVSLTLSEGEYDYEALLAALPQLPMLETLSLPETERSADELQALAAAAPDCAVTWSVLLQGSPVESTATSVRLVGITGDDIPDVTAALSRLTDLQEVLVLAAEEPEAETAESAQTEDKQSADEAQSAESEEAEPVRVPDLSIADIKAIEDAAPYALVSCAFDFYGQTLSTLSERVEYDGTVVSSADEVREVLDILQCCSYFKLADCGLDNETMAALRDEYPQTEIVWRVYFGEYFHCLTDEESIRAIFALDDTNSYNLRYCTKVKYMDIGHDDTMKDISFCAYMPDLEILILSGSEVYDLTPLANHEHLIFLECVFCGWIDDISPLESCPNLAYLNISYAKTTDLSALEDKPLERFMFYGSKISAADQQAFADAHPDCWVTFDGENPYILGWRYDDQGYTWCDMYKRVREVFDYEHNYYNHS